MKTDRKYQILAARTLPDLAAGWEHPDWSHAGIAEIAHFRPEGSHHQPQTRLRLLYGADAIYGIFQVHDRFVRSIRTRYLDEVWKDACVEVFFQPKADKGYFNIEMNAGGAHLCSYITDATRTPEGFKEFVRLPAEIGKQIKTRSTLPQVVEPEIPEPLCWELKFLVPFNVFESYVGPLGELGAQPWRGNFFKCAEDNSHPHWASWAPVDEFNFHLPRCFGQIQFE